MFAFYGSIGIAVVANVFYHVAMKQTSERLDPLVSLLLTYLVAATTCLVAIPFFGRLSLRENIAYLGWPSVLLGISICFLELGFLLAYRAGWNLSTAALACNVAVGLLLIPLGLFYFKEHLTIGEWSRNSACDDGPVADWTAVNTDLTFSPASYTYLVTLTFASWNQIAGWLRRLAGLQDAA